ncbi:hypothetical protein ACROYT_G028170 [Oculina patagonica]
MENVNEHIGIVVIGEVGCRRSAHLSKVIFSQGAVSAAWLGHWAFFADIPGASRPTALCLCKGGRFAGQVFNLLLQLQVLLLLTPSLATSESGREDFLIYGAFTNLNTFTCKASATEHNHKINPSA